MDNVFDKTQRRKSLILTPGFTQSRRSSPQTTPTPSPNRIRIVSSNVSPISPSKLPVKNYRKRTVSNVSTLSLDDHLTKFQSFLNADIQNEQLLISETNCEIESFIEKQYEYSSVINDLERKKQKVLDLIDEYRIGYPLKLNLFNSRKREVENEIKKYETVLEQQKVEEQKKFDFKIECIRKEFNEVEKSAQFDDDEKNEARTSKIQQLNDEKDQLLKEIEVAKANMDGELEKFKESLDYKKADATKEIQDSKNKVQSEYMEKEHEFQLLNEKYKLLKSRNDSKLEEISQIGKQITDKESELSKTKFKIQDIENLIIHLKSDLQTTTNLCNDFENNEYKQAKDNWVLTNSLLSLEKYKRLKIEIQIRELSGIPNVIILDYGNNEIFKSSNLIEFFKPVNYDWKIEVLTSLEASLDGVSSCLLRCSENIEDSNIINDIENHLNKTIQQNDRFQSFQISITGLNSIAEINKIMKDKITLPDSISAIYINMLNKVSKTSRNSIILILNVSNVDTLNQTTEILNNLQTFTIVENVSELWLEPISNLITIKPVRSRPAYAFLNG